MNVSFSLPSLLPQILPLKSMKNSISCIKLDEETHLKGQNQDSYTKLTQCYFWFHSVYLLFVPPNPDAVLVPEEDDVVWDEEEDEEGLE